MLPGWKLANCQWQWNCWCRACDQLVPPVTVPPSPATARPAQRDQIIKIRSLTHNFNHVVTSPRISGDFVKEACQQQWAPRCQLGQDQVEGSSLTVCSRAQPGFPGARTVPLPPSPMATTLSPSSSMGDQSLAADLIMTLNIALSRPRTKHLNG